MTLNIERMLKHLGSVKSKSKCLQIITETMDFYQNIPMIFLVSKTN